MAIIATMKGSPALPKLRRLKVYEKIIIYNAGYMRNTISRHPEIRLMGKWLADSGFTPGDAIRVSVAAGKLVITRDAGGEEGITEAPAG
ncbi:type I toxin-antitoxin system SymE family toxin [Niabella sp. CC-SYL272]|uniref:SymE family type I addiction module toxin n=1 Tax=Niabella agricola TaxID=2891571 RepID=UPI001F3638C6|nr:SymE family type I addiction module toxin [Niabella agricola]MCF3107382.1 type I toxin-antitoxin system SymE family toxin [Niabella agricola]